MIVDLAGFPFPLTHTEFSHDTALKKKIAVLGTYVEINREFQDAFEVIKILQADDLDKKFSSFGALAMKMPDMLLSYSILQYAKPFVESQGSTNLIGKERAISSDTAFLEFHDFLMKIRNKFYAHRELNINRHQLHVLQNFPEDGEIDLITDGQSRVMLVHKSINLAQFNRNIYSVGCFLNTTIARLKKSIIDNFTVEQRNYLLNNNIDSLRALHMNDGNYGVSEPFQSRSAKASDDET